MNNLNFTPQPAIIFGKDTHQKIGALVKEYGFKKVLIHYGGGSIKRPGLYDVVTASLKENGIEYVELRRCAAQSLWDWCTRSRPVPEGKG